MLLIFIKHMLSGFEIISVNGIFDFFIKTFCIT